MQYELDEIQNEIECITHALSLTPDGDPDLPHLLADLGRYHAKRFQFLGRLDDIQKAVDSLSTALTMTQDDEPDLPHLYDILGVSHNLRFQCLGDLCDITQSIKCASRAVSLTSEDQSDFSRRLANLGAAYVVRYHHVGELSNLEKAIEHESRAVTLTPDGHPNLSSRLSNLGRCYGNRFERLGEAKDIAKSIEYSSRALDSASSDDPYLPVYHANLGTSYTDRYQRFGGLNDLEKAIEHEFRAVSLTPDNHPELSARLDGLGVSYNLRYQHLGELGDIENSIELKSRAVALTPEGHPDLSQYLGHLEVSYADRFHRLGELDDIEKAIEYGSRAVDLTPDGHPQAPGRLADLGKCYSMRYKHTADLDDLEKSIKYKSRAVASTSDDHPDAPTTLSNLAVSYNDRFEHLGELDDLEKAIQYGSSALALIPDDHPMLPMRLINLGVTYGNRYWQLREPGDLEKSIEYESRALSLTPDGHPDLPQLRFNMALSFLYYSQHTGELSFLNKSLDFFRGASQSLEGVPRDRFKFAFEWAKRASNHDSLNCIEAYQTAINLLPQFIWLGATTNQRYNDLLMAESLAVSAAKTAILSSEYILALEWLEHARCVVWNQSLMLRSPLDQLRTSHPDLASRLQTVANKLHHASTMSREAQVPTSRSLTSEQIAQQHRHLAMEYEGLLSQAREIPGFEELLRPMKANNLTHAARNWPIIVINCHKDGCDALLIIPGGGTVKHVALLNFTEEKAQKARSEIDTALGSKGLRERGVKRRLDPGQIADFGRVLANLWNEVVKPVLDFLGYTSNVLKGNLPHVTWCPTGMVSFLPLHAAGDYSQPQSRVFDYIISSYTPTLTALLSSTPTVLNRTNRVLAIGMENTPGYKPLSGTLKEIACVEGHVKNIADYSQLLNSQATTAAVLDAMEQHDWVHLACHAHQNVQDPTKSGFFMHDGTLDLASINRRSFKSKGLAFLSACQTATGDERLPDEAVHLASGMLMAGYSSVIATMWSVVDDDAPLVADRVYEQLMKDGKIGNGEAGRALHDAVAELRAKVGENAFERWVPYIHIGS